MGCCSSPRTTVAGVAVLHFFGALGCIGLCSYLLSLEGPKLEQILTQSWTLLTTMHLPVVVDANGNVVSNHTRSSTESVALDESNISHSHTRGRSAYDIQPLLDHSKDDLKPLPTEGPGTEGPRVIASDEYLKYDNESAEVTASSVLDRDARILLNGDNVVDDMGSPLTTELNMEDDTTEPPHIGSSESDNDLEEYITENIFLLHKEIEPFYQNTSSENSSLSMENENATEVPIIDFEGLRSLGESFFTSITTTEDTNAVSLNSDSSVLYVDVPDHTITSIGAGITDAPPDGSSSSTRVTGRSQTATPHQDENSTTSSPSSSEKSDMVTILTSPRNFPLDIDSGDNSLTSPEFPLDIDSGDNSITSTEFPLEIDSGDNSLTSTEFPRDIDSDDNSLTSTEFIPVSPKSVSPDKYVTETSTLRTETSLSSNQFTVPATSPSTSPSSRGPSSVSRTSSSTREFENVATSTPGLTSTSSPATTEHSTSAKLESLPSTLPLRSHSAATRYSHLLVDENSSFVNVQPTINTSNVSSDEEPFTITVPPIITTTGFLSTLLTSSSDTEGDPELESLLFELRAGASVLGLLVYFIVCTIAAALLVAAAIWRLEALMVPWLIMEWISVFGAITAVGILTWRLLVEGVLLWCWWVVVLCIAGVVVLILCLVLVLEAYQTLPYEATCEAADSYEMQYVTDKRRTSISGAQRSERLREYWSGRETTNLH